MRLCQVKVDYHQREGESTEPVFVDLLNSPGISLRQSCAGILKQSREVRSRVGKGLSYIPARQAT
jgi:hypothetical protein